jgi:hypothetical protein
MDENIRDNPLYTLAVYGIKNKNTTNAENIRIAADLYRDPKNSGIVALSKCLDITRVRRPKTSHASSDPIIALPNPIQIADTPYAHPNLPA